MAVEVNTEFRAQFMEDKCLYDSLSQAIRLGKSSGLSEKQLKPLLIEKQRFKKVCADNSNKMLHAMPLATNTVQIYEGWHAIRYLNQKTDTTLKIDILKLDDVYLLKRDARYERELNRNEIETLIPAMIDEEALELYKQKLAVRAVELLLQYTGVYAEGIAGATDPNEPIVAEETTTVSAHAGKRYVQRVLGIKNDTEAEEYRRTHIQEVNSAVLEGYLNAELVWEEKADDITYWFDSQNYMYVKGKQNGTPNIITMYEEDYGFSKEINRMITFEQLKVLALTKDELTAAEVGVSNVNGRVESEIRGINDQIALLESQVALLVAQRAESLAERDKVGKVLRVHKDKYVAEFNKLFRKWDA